MNEAIKTSAVAEHAVTCRKTEKNLSVSKVCQETNYQRRKIKEAFYIRHNPNINRDEGSEVSEAWIPISHLTECFTITNRPHTFTHSRGSEETRSRGIDLADNTPTAPAQNSLLFFMEDVLFPVNGIIIFFRCDANRDVRLFMLETTGLRAVVFEAALWLLRDKMSRRAPRISAAFSLGTWGPRQASADVIMSSKGTFLGMGTKFRPLASTLVSFSCKGSPLRLTTVFSVSAPKLRLLLAADVVNSQDLER
ncbi:hypothetical protein M514_27997 [Trichuris suis]|uniref:Uncharacterized protein n=1 Tax=Trichuris suis TaxID=68888 RepID=A0A085MRH7_9BILA|nr:hypothetical protein M514_27997 [Trichuris suis]